MKKVTLTFILFFLFAVLLPVFSNERYFLGKYLSYPSYSSSKTKVSQKEFKHAAKVALLRGKKIWQDNLKNHENTYFYTRSFSSWVGFGHKTLVVIKDGKAILRAFKTFHNQKKVFVSTKYIERQNEVGHHKQGFKPLLVSKLYQQCTTVMSLSLDYFGVGLHITENGTIKSCFSRPLNCVDDCSTSYNIDILKFGKPNKKDIAKFLDN